MSDGVECRDCEQRTDPRSILEVWPLEGVGAVAGYSQINGLDI